ncbi:formiminotetrahydrofolate cyclodeaminase [Thermosporothrix hazakensis]|jgi:formiminotetrahydrofolate cyclodeaminase|uniref:Formiminotetrahydrofolate cyclodeaminase n=2 Tax=Thermosporothrix TaxID=768650 RepID=A0A326ULU8_THEHA|nr:cyclodeaminase/cyclohydrolase family protein [Thermosporothrix hazakensis]PZW30644.1 formiminotetrahydrofolate cyclodeaminase [Thermosporothrix hazakensis]BBH91360.1 methenyltetrahydrofolate cyclohydrolase [Thermosporothrix sp. COM3]GCE49507.1 methenyltetrahydrofolate cyclohydrolase [Thermosporothrix hazakensis]
MYLDKPLHTYLDDLASGQPTPGGGSTAALNGAMGAGLVCMVARLTLGKKAYLDVQQEIEALIQQAEALRSRFQNLIQADIEAYGHLSASFKLPKETAEEKAARSRAIQERLAEAAQVPLDVVESAATLMLYCLRIAEIGNKNVLSDVATAAALASCAGTGGSYMVKINLDSLKDATLVHQLSDRLQHALERIATGNQQVLKVIGERA